MPGRYEDDDDYPRRRRRSREDWNGDRRSRNDPEDDFADDYRPHRRKSGGDGLGISAMILGIVAIIVDILTPFGACICPLVVVGAIIGVVVGIVAVIMGFMSRAQQPSGFGLAGIITGFAAIAIGLTIVILIAVGVGVLAMNQPPPNRAPNQNFNNPRFK